MVQNSLIKGVSSIPASTNEQLSDIRTSSATRGLLHRMMNGRAMASDEWELVGKNGVLTGDAEEDRFGFSVAMSKDGNIIVVGAPDYIGSNPGYVKVYRLHDDDSESWIQLGETIIGEGAWDKCGHSVDINDKGDIIIVGAPFRGVFNNGQTRIYQYTNGKWEQRGQDLDGDEMSDYFGSSVAINGAGDRVIIGGPNSGVDGVLTGQTKIYEYNHYTDMWVQLGSDIMGEDKNNLFGSSVDINTRGDVVVIGAIWNNGSNGYLNAGHARIYEYTNGHWQKRGQDLDGDQALDRFGTSVGINGAGDIVIVGGPGNDDIGGNSGHSKVYEYNEETQMWEQLGADIKGEGERYTSGFSVDINVKGDVIVIGAIGSAGNIFSDADAYGRARIYRYTNGQWKQQGQQDNLDGDVISDYFPWSVGMNGDGNRIIAGGPENDGNGNNSGHVKVFEFFQEEKFEEDEPTSAASRQYRPLSAIALLIVLIVQLHGSALL